MKGGGRFIIHPSYFILSSPGGKAQVGRVTDDFLLPLLRCPLSRQPLAGAPAELLARLETERAAGTLRNRAGEPLPERIEAGLVRADGTVFYPVRSGIPLLVGDESVVLSTT